MTSELDLREVLTLIQREGVMFCMRPAEIKGKADRQRLELTLTQPYPSRRPVVRMCLTRTETAAFLEDDISAGIYLRELVSLYRMNKGT